MCSGDQFLQELRESKKFIAENCNQEQHNAANINPPDEVKGQQVSF